METKDLLTLKKHLDDIFDSVINKYVGYKEFEKIMDETGDSLITIVELHIKNNIELANKINNECKKRRDIDSSHMLNLAQKLCDESSSKLTGRPASKILYN